jgi:hypothetical protein
VNKKKQKNFDLLKHLALTVTNPAGIKSFLGLSQITTSIAVSPSV